MTSDSRGLGTQTKKRWWKEKSLIIIYQNV